MTLPLHARCCLSISLPHSLTPPSSSSPPHRIHLSKVTSDLVIPLIKIFQCHPVVYEQAEHRDGLGCGPGSCVFPPLFPEWVLGFLPSVPFVLDCPSAGICFYASMFLTPTFAPYPPILSPNAFTCGQTSSSSHQVFPSSTGGFLRLKHSIFHFSAGLQYLILCFLFPTKSQLPAERACVLLIPLLPCSKTLKYLLS